MRERQQTQSDHGYPFKSGREIGITGNNLPSVIGRQVSFNSQEGVLIDLLTVSWIGRPDSGNGVKWKGHVWILPEGHLDSFSWSVAVLVSVF